MLPPFPIFVFILVELLQVPTYVPGRCERAVFLVSAPAAMLILVGILLRNES